MFWILGLQILAHLSIIPMLLYGTGMEFLISISVYFFTGCIGMSMTFHRFMAHNSWQPSRWLEAFGVLCGSLGIAGSSLAWTAVHREHHKAADTIKDPHSPSHKGFFRVQCLGMLYEPDLRFVQEKLKDPVHQFFHRYYLPINFSYVVILLALDPFSIVYAYLFPAAILWECSSAVNTVGHLWGYKRSNTLDKSKNNPLLALMTWGEGWHNNHHSSPSSYYFGKKWYELDVGGQLIHLFNICRNK